MNGSVRKARETRVKMALAPYFKDEKIYEKVVAELVVYVEDEVNKAITQDRLIRDEQREAGK